MECWMFSAAIAIFVIMFIEFISILADMLSVDSFISILEFSRSLLIWFFIVCLGKAL